MTAASWYGNDPRWVSTFDAQAYKDFGRRLSVSLRAIPVVVGDPAVVWSDCAGAVTRRAWPAGVVPVQYRVYRVEGVEVQARAEPIDVVVVFERYRHFGGARFADGRDFPVVHADRYDESPHRYSDGSLCLYYPLDPEQRRWTADKGLRSLISLAADHIFFEDWHRHAGEWIAPEAPHGFSSERRKVA